MDRGDRGAAVSPCAPPRSRYTKKAAPVFRGRSNRRWGKALAFDLLLDDGLAAMLPTTLLDDHLLADVVMAPAHVAAVIVVATLDDDLLAHMAAIAVAVLDDDLLLHRRLRLGRRGSHPGEY